MDGWDYANIGIAVAIVFLVLGGVLFGDRKWLESLKDDWVSIKSFQAGKISLPMRSVLLVLQSIAALVVAFTTFVYLITLPFRSQKDDEKWMESEAEHKENEAEEVCDDCGYAYSSGEKVFVVELNGIEAFAGPCCLKKAIKRGFIILRTHVV